jgi:hypothetical protein
MGKSILQQTQQLNRIHTQNQMGQISNIQSIRQQGNDYGVVLTKTGDITIPNSNDPHAANGPQHSHKHNTTNLIS